MSLYENYSRMAPAVIIVLVLISIALVLILTLLSDGAQGANIRDGDVAGLIAARLGVPVPDDATPLRRTPPIRTLREFRRQHGDVLAALFT